MLPSLAVAGPSSVLGFLPGESCAASGNASNPSNYSDNSGAGGSESPSTSNFFAAMGKLLGGVVKGALPGQPQQLLPYQQKPTDVPWVALGVGGVVLVGGIFAVRAMMKRK